jgi:hypothetical protein
MANTKRSIKMIDIPENVDWKWIAHQIVATRNDTRALRDDFSIMVAIMRRVENSQISDREEWRGLFDSIRHLRERVEKLEEAK